MIIWSREGYDLVGDARINDETLGRCGELGESFPDGLDGNDKFDQCGTAAT